MNSEELVRDMVRRLAPGAGAFIVTVFGDLMVSRRRALATRSIVELCAAAGISDTLARTALSRLVASDTLVGSRAGRRSFYRLTDSAQLDFEAAATRIYPRPRKTGWVLIADPPAPPDPPGYAELAPGLFLAPAEAPVTPGGVVFSADWRAGEADALAAFAARRWPLADTAADYTVFLADFAPVAATPPFDLTGQTALALRLLVVHGFRKASLQDPGLPPDALPAEWPGSRARTVFTELYRLLSEKAEAYAAQQLQSEAGELGPSGPDFDLRLEAMVAARSF